MHLGGLISDKTASGLDTLGSAGFNRQVKSQGRIAREDTAHVTIMCSCCGEYQIRSLGRQASFVLLLFPSRKGRIHQNFGPPSNG